MHRLLTSWLPLLWSTDSELMLSSYGTQAQLLHSMWDPPGPGIEPVSPALAANSSSLSYQVSLYPRVLKEALILQISISMKINIQILFLT